MKIIVSNSAIAPHVKQTVLAYENAGMLSRFLTSFFFHPKNKLSSFLSKIVPIRKQINRRAFVELPIEKFESKPFRELLRTFSSHFLNEKLTDKIWEWAELDFDSWVSKKIKGRKIDAIHTYEYIGLETIKEAKKNKIFTIYEQPSVHYSKTKQILDDQFIKFPLLLNREQEEKQSKTLYRNKRRNQELNTTDLIICNSSFTKKTLVTGGVNEDKIIVVPLPFPKPLTKKRVKNFNNKPVIFLHAGNQSIIKGSHVLYASWKQCNFDKIQAELWLIGKMNLPEDFRNNLPGNVIIRNTIPHTELMSLYQKADVLVMPTLADGFGMVITEAMSQGLPVIATENCCAPDFIKHNFNGWIVPVDDEESLSNQLKSCVLDKDKLHEIGSSAIETSRKWQKEDYSELLVSMVENKFRSFEANNKVY